MAPLDDFRADLARYRQDDWLERGWWISERSIWAIAMYRLGQRLLLVRPLVLRKILQLPYSCALTLVQGLSGIEIWPNTQIGPGIRIYHGQGLVINAGSKIGANVLLRQGVTIGTRRPGDKDAPVIGDNVQFGAYAQVFGGITIGDDARIGSMSVVLHDVPAGATAVGAPARTSGPSAAAQP